MPQQELLTKYYLKKKLSWISHNSWNQHTFFKINHKVLEESMRFLKNALRQRKLSLNLTQTPDAIEAKNDEEQSQQGKDTAGQSI